MWKKKWIPSQLKAAGVLGINARNLFINQVNKREFYPRVDNKVLSKSICQELKIPVPKTYMIMNKLVDIKKFAQTVEPYQEFVIKPARGAGGRGIIVVAEHNNNEYTTPGGEIYSHSALRYHIATILSGLYSLGGHKDQVIIEQRIRPHTIFGDLAVSGTPDIRVIVFNYQPIMAMLRLPTRASRGRANLHQGAVGVGVNIQTGETSGGVYKGKSIRNHPDTNYSLQGIVIQHWPLILDIAKRLSEKIELGYLGVDIVLDVQEGPLVLEANARPGLAIQIANNSGIRNLLELGS